MRDIWQTLTHVLRGPRTCSLLERFDIEPRRFWLLFDLFDELSERGEMMDQLGWNGVALSVAAKVYFGLSTVLSIFFVWAEPSPGTYLAGFLAFTAFLLVTILLSEIGNSLVNPAEGLVLAHQPVNGATYTAAKLSHLLRILLYLVPGMNAAPAFAALMLKGVRWWYPALHLAATLTVGLVTAFLCCALFGWLVLVIPVRRLKAAGQFAASLPFLGFIWMQQILNFARQAKIQNWLPANGAIQLILAFTIGLGAIAAVAVGIRSLTADYLIRVSGLMRGGASGGSHDGRAPLGFVVGRFFGGQAARAGFTFVSRMVLRDWQFRRQFIGLLLPASAALVSAVAGGWPRDPLVGQFAPVQFLPHAVGVLILFACMLLPYGNDYKGACILRVVPSQAFDGFARGIHAYLWIGWIVIPHLILLPLLAWPWGIGHAVIFVAYSMAAASCYLALELRLIEGVPFSKQADAARGAIMLPVLIGSGVAVAIAASLQYLVIFRSGVRVEFATAVVAAAAYWFTRGSLKRMAESMRYHLGLLPAEAAMLYKEVAG
ncbi:MAG: hypothetical protein U0Q18_33210 [Bryobacteraceae bacterium]